MATAAKDDASEATEPLGIGSDGQPVYLKDIWPTTAEVQQFIEQNITSALFKSSVIALMLLAVTTGLPT